ncbi:PREDICTED: uncharacterized protein LOC109207623 [Nicotiana attenuata]|uniref:Uncharacterized protein n=1 Tax=Nicotiana attenuata TaxID=49451 RepID=A0A314KSN3_NICAT|nr:PREDICTED: uncharacterized protein LOC109207623 [Nicotiana attenuata]XP_019226118.1 PREDICTED: uncharacterized protein LOC109207623 [Nicotiana attenuata]OIT32225.1 hypothetical protein A4A49_25641 [Nicotiana attenuata]
MDHNNLGTSQVKKEYNTKNESTESNQKLHEASKEVTSEGNQGQVGRNVAGDVAPRHVNSQGEVNMEADITMDDVIRAGGLGARDDLNSVLPIATDTTDFEASIRDAWDYEGLRESIKRPGLGWTEPAKK